MAEPRKPAAPPAAPTKAVATTKPVGAVAKTDGAEVEERKESKLAWFVGWILVPGALLGGIWAGGVAVGVHLHESWFSRAVMWVAGLF